MSGLTGLLTAVALCLFGIAANRLIPRLDRLLALAENGTLARLSKKLQKLIRGITDWTTLTVTDFPIAEGWGERLKLAVFAPLVIPDCDPGSTFLSSDNPANLRFRGCFQPMTWRPIA